MRGCPTIVTARRRVVLAAAAALLAASFLWPLHASAQGDDMTRAREAFDRGQDLFDKGDFVAAREAFQDSLAAFPHYRTLFNIALCEEKLGRIPEAVEMYQRYVDWPAEVPNREEVALKVAELRELLPPEPEPELEPEPEPEPGPAETQGPDLIVPGWITVGAGAAGMITGGVLLGVAQSRANQLQKTDGEVYDPDVHDALQDEGRTYEKAGWIVGGIGIAAVAAGVVMLLASDTGAEPEDAPDVEAAVLPVEGGVAIGAGWSF